MSDGRDMVRFASDDHNMQAGGHTAGHTATAEGGQIACGTQVGMAHLILIADSPLLPLNLLGGLNLAVWCQEF